MELLTLHTTFSKNYLITAPHTKAGVIIKKLHILTMNCCDCGSHNITSREIQQKQNDFSIVPVWPHQLVFTAA